MNAFAYNDKSVIALNPHAFVRLQAWLSPAFPTGGFAYSHGLEQAYECGRINSVDELTQWLKGILHNGAGRSDAIICAHSWKAHADHFQLSEIASLCEAMASSSERHLETMAQGDAFLQAVQVWDKSIDLNGGFQKPLSVAVGAIGARIESPIIATVTAFLQAFMSALIQAAQRLGQIGQKAGVQILSTLEPDIIQTANIAASAPLSEVGGSVFMSDIMSMQHETQHSRIFRS
ncbi:urease accessory protein UreF [Hirschia litorea]|uniref:Urease accessory protein UreF n=1 Tax=Hirschia litorea TaxID=1199156 RepID=A0ABW2IPY9_9PROT